MAYSPVYLKKAMRKGDLSGLQEKQVSFSSPERVILQTPTSPTTTEDLLITLPGPGILKPSTSGPPLQEERAMIYRPPGRTTSWPTPLTMQWIDLAEEEQEVTILSGQSRSWPTSPNKLSRETSPVPSTSTAPYPTPSGPQTRRMIRLSSPVDETEELRMQGRVDAFLASCRDTIREEGLKPDPQGLISEQEANLYPGASHLVAVLPTSASREAASRPDLSRVKGHATVLVDQDLRLPQHLLHHLPHLRDVELLRPWRNRRAEYLQKLHELNLDLSAQYVSRGVRRALTQGPYGPQLGVEASRREGGPQQVWMRAVP